MRVWMCVAALSLARCAPSSQAPDLAHGRRIAQVEGCISCHGDKLDGHLVEEDAQFALGSGLVDHNQNMTVAARAMAAKKAVGQRS